MDHLNHVYALCYVNSDCTSDLNTRSNLLESGQNTSAFVYHISIAFVCHDSPYGFSVELNNSESKQYSDFM